MKRDKKDAILGGVCSGLAKYMGIPTAAMRAIWVVATIWLGAPLLLYPIFWVLMPAEQDERGFINISKLQLNKENAILAGVCSGIADVSGLNVVVIRVLWALGTLYLGFGILAYLICWILMAQNSKPAV